MISLFALLSSFSVNCASGNSQYFKNFYKKRISPSECKHAKSPFSQNSYEELDDTYASSTILEQRQRRFGGVDPSNFLEDLPTRNSTKCKKGFIPFKNIFDLKSSRCTEDELSTSAASLQSSNISKKSSVSTLKSSDSIEECTSDDSIDWQNK